MVLAHNINENRRTTDIQISQDITFDNMLLVDRTLAGLKESGFFKPSPIQLHGIPLGKCGFDLLLEAKSGTGKTAVFSIISLEKLDLNKGLQVIILAPTREIAAQICDVIRQIGSNYDGLSVEVVMGGLPIQDDINKFKANKVHIVVGSPGRLKHLIHDKHMDVDSVRLLILDEADKLMENAFLADIKYIHSSLPSQKQVILSSATYPEYTKELIDQFVCEPQHICPNSDCVLLGVIQKVTFVKYNNNIVKQTENRFKELLKILTKKQFKQCLVFCNYQTRVGDLHKMLAKEKWPAEQLYGKQEQTDRLDALRTLQEYKCRILVSTDLAARGIDASNVDLVINFEPPFEWQTYLHRIGRAGRYGSYGMAITILSEGAEQKKFFNLLQPLKLSDNLTSMWKDDTKNDHIVIEPNIQTATAESLLLSKISEDNNYKQLWDLLCDNMSSGKQVNNFESFDNLAKSFKELEVNNDITSFSDLLTSFNNNNLHDIKETFLINYKNVSLPDKSSNFYVNRIRCLQENLVYDQNCNNDAKHKVVSDLAERNNNEVINNHSYDKSMRIINYRNEGKLKYKSMDSEDERIELANLGLPVAFASAKDKPRNKKTFQTDRFFKNQISITTEKTCEDNNDIRERRTMSKFRAHVEKNCLKANEQHNQTDSKTMIMSSNKHNNNLKEPSSVVNNKIYHSSNLKHTKNCYTKWYSQLKLQVKQLEMAMYIEELSKL